MVDLRNKGINGADAQEALDCVGITVSKNAIPFDTGFPRGNQRSWQLMSPNPDISD